MMSQKTKAPLHSNWLRLRSILYLSYVTPSVTHGIMPHIIHSCSCMLRQFIHVPVDVPPLILCMYIYIHIQSKSLFQSIKPKMQQFQQQKQQQNSPQSLYREVVGQ